MDMKLRINDLMTLQVAINAASMCVNDIDHECLDAAKEAAFEAIAKAQAIIEDELARVVAEERAINERREAARRRIQVVDDDLDALYGPQDLSR